MIKSLKEGILNAVPAPMAKWLYLLRNSEIEVKGEPLDDVTITMGIPKRSELWINRLGTPKGHEYGLCLWLQNKLREDEVFYDVGSLYGFFPTLLSKLRPKAFIHVFEADWRHVMFVRNNGVRNQANPWKVNHGYVSDNNEGLNISLDTYSAQPNAYPTLMKIDVDGGEFHVLTGCKKLIESRKTEFLVEVHPIELAKINVTVQQIIDFFPDDYVLKALANIRGETEEWTDDLSVLDRDNNPYLYAGPKSISRFS